MRNREAACSRRPFPEALRRAFSDTIRESAMTITTNRIAPRPCDAARDSGNSPPSAASPRTVKVGLIGLGTIGRAFREILVEREDAAGEAASPRLVLER